MVVPKIKQRIPLLDNDWIKENIELPKDGQKTYKQSFKQDEIIIYDGNGLSITNFYELKNKLPCLDQGAVENFEYTHEFDNAFMDLNPLGRVKINEVKYVYDIVHENNYNTTVDAQQTVDIFDK
jgi:hypothetical protein